VDSRPSEDQAAFAGRGRSDEGLALWLPSLSDPPSVAHPPPSIAWRDTSSGTGADSPKCLGIGALGQTRSRAAIGEFRGSGCVGAEPDCQAARAPDCRLASAARGASHDPRRRYARAGPARSDPDARHRGDSRRSSRRLERAPTLTTGERSRRTTRLGIRSPWKAVAASSGRSRRTV